MSQKQIADFKRTVDHLLTQEKASLFFGGGVRAFHKYETGENAQSRPLDILLKLMDNGKISMDDLKSVG